MNIAGGYIETLGKDDVASFNDAGCKKLEALGLNQTDISRLSGIATNAMVGSARKGGKASSVKNVKILAASLIVQKICVLGGEPEALFKHKGVTVKKKGDAAVARAKTPVYPGTSFKAWQSVLNATLTAQCEAQSSKLTSLVVTNALALFFQALDKAFKKNELSPLLMEIHASGAAEITGDPRAIAAVKTWWYQKGGLAEKTKSRFNLLKPQVIRKRAMEASSDSPCKRFVNEASLTLGSPAMSPAAAAEATPVSPGT